MSLRASSVRHRAALAAVALTAPLLAVAVASPADAAKKRPDLTVQAVGRPPAKAEPGDSFSVATKVRNAGRAKAAASTTSFVLSEDRAAGAGDIRVGTQRLPALKPRATASRTTRLSLPTSVPAGTYHLIACADSGGAVKETSERNNCRTADRTVEVTGDFEGRVTGTLNFVDQGSTNVGGVSNQWNYSATAGIVMDVEGPQVFEEVFTSRNSTYAIEGIGTEVSGDATCTRTTTRTRNGSGTFDWSSDPFATEISGAFVRSDRGRLRVALEMTYSAKTDRVSSGTHCSSSTTQTASAVNITSILLEETARTATSITYRVKSYESEMGIPSDWDSISGQLTLRIGQG